MPLAHKPVLCQRRVYSGEMSNLLLTSSDAAIGITILHFLETENYYG
jgi:hypothetical protein